MPADGFFEWRLIDGRKQPTYFALRDRRPFAFAGLWEWWVASDGHPVESCVILTCEPNDLVRPVHDRMPVMLDRAAHAAWLAPAPALAPAAVKDSVIHLTTLLRPVPAEEMESHPVSPLVNNAANETAECVVPYRYVTQQDLFS